MVVDGVKKGKVWLYVGVGVGGKVGGKELGI